MGLWVIGCCTHITALIGQLDVYGGEVETTSNDLHSGLFFDFVRDTAEVYTSDGTENDESSFHAGAVNGKD